MQNLLGMRILDRAVTRIMQQKNYNVTLSF